MRSFSTFPHESPAQTRARLASGFTRHVAIALTACGLGLLLG